MILMHCFGTDKTFPVNTQLAVNMIAASGIKEITLNTHNIEQVTDWQDLSVSRENRHCSKPIRSIIEA